MLEKVLCMPTVCETYRRYPGLFFSMQARESMPANSVAKLTGVIPACGPIGKSVHWIPHRLPPPELKTEVQKALKKVEKK
jgi:hypothetical protein